MINSKVTYRSTGSFSDLVLDYLDLKENLLSFYGNPPSITGIKNQIEYRSKFDCNRSVLVDTLNEQYGSIQNPVINKNIELLRNKNTFTICTGHQVCIFTGPLYFIYKIASTITTARKLKSEFPEFDFVPVYWMATEDHDFKEINHVYLNGVKRVWDVETKGAVGELMVDNVIPLLKDLLPLFNTSIHGEEFLGLLHDAYKPGRSLADATRHFVNALFSEYGLIIIDANTRSLKALFASEMEQELRNQQGLKCVGETIEKLSSEYKIQVTPRNINMFLFHEGVRHRIEFANGKYELIGSLIPPYSLDGILKILKDSPERFSPNVIMRPLYQEKILPNLAYIGGGGELAYWLELKNYFEKLNVSFPVLMLRNSFLMLSDKAAKIAGKMQLTDEQLFFDEDKLIRVKLKKLLKDWDIDKNSSTLEDAYKGIISDIGKVDRTLEDSAQAELQRALNRLKHLDQKVQHALKRKNEEMVTRVAKIRSELFPDGFLQERYINLIEYYLLYGSTFIEEIIENTDPFDQRFSILKPEPSK